MNSAGKILKYIINLVDKEDDNNQLNKKETNNKIKKKYKKKFIIIHL